mgnify:FL=1|tara:strand:- start:81 stop:287 length:207 start_codon:yes stop_codon:yes gene_type:complete
MKLVKWTTKKGKEVRRYPVLYGKARKQEKREQAAERQAEHDKLTLEQKIANAVPGGKEHKRLTKGVAV